MKRIQKIAIIFSVLLIYCMFSQYVQAGVPDSATSDAGTVKTDGPHVPGNPAPSLSGQSPSIRLAVAEKEIEHLRETVSQLEQKVSKRQEKIDSLWVIQLSNFLSQEIVWTLLFVLLSVASWLYWIGIPRKIRDKYNKEEWAKATIDAALLPERERLSSLIKEQIKENRRRILARDRKIHIRASKENLSEEEVQDLERFTEFLNFSGFNNITSTVDEAELIVLFGTETCKREWQQLSNRLRGELVPVILYTAPHQDEINPRQFEVATFANTLPTAITHLHNFAMLTARVD